MDTCDEICFAACERKSKPHVQMQEGRFSNIAGEGAPQLTAELLVAESAGRLTTLMADGSNSDGDGFALERFGLLLFSDELLRRSITQ